MMNRVALLGLAGALMSVMASCGGLPQAPQSESVVLDSARYTIDGQVVSADAVRQLEARHGALFMLATATDSGATWAVFTGAAELESAKNALATPQGICVGRSRTTVWEQEGYAGSSLEIAKGQSFGDLGTLFQPDGEDWDNDIEAYKAACNAYTYFYTGTNFSGSVLVTRGDVLSDMGGWNNIVSSIQVTN
jgi:hypothetical protein